jgi:hypothetical protein
LRIFNGIQKFTLPHSHAIAPKSRRFRRFSRPATAQALHPFLMSMAISTRERRKLFETASDHCDADAGTAPVEEFTASDTWRGNTDGQPS